MKKLIFVFVFALLGSYFQSAQAQTFSRVVTFGIDTTLNPGNNGYSDIIYTVPQNKIFKLVHLEKDLYFYTRTINCPGCSFSQKYPSKAITINDISIADIFQTNTRGGTEIWLKAGDQIKFNGTPEYDRTRETMEKYRIRVFLSGIEYDVP